ncbi:MAG: hypothetical protein M3T55_01095 [Pseudomonadota bacterium]|nr:hypothetical protein [Pseudomonadota bacterium]
MSHRSPRPPRIAAVHVRGGPAKRPDQNEGRGRLLNWIVEKVSFEAGWGRLDALLLPAGFFRLEVALGPLDSMARAQAIEGSAIAFECRKAAERLARSCGALLVLGIDTRRAAKGFSGDQFMAAWRGDAIVGSARKVFPSAKDTAPAKKWPYLLFAADADDMARIVDLPSGGRALLLVCYDAFLFSEIARGPTSRRASMRWVADGQEHGRRTVSAERNGMIEKFEALVGREKTTVALIAVHGFEQPGRDTRWQRHGIASASSALGGGLAVGAAHYQEWLPDADELDQSTLASAGVGSGHLLQGLHRTAHKLAAKDALYVEVPGSPDLCAVVRLFQGRAVRGD